MPRETAYTVFGHDPSGNTLFITSHSHNLPKVYSHVYRLNSPVQLLFLTDDIGQSTGNDRFPLKPSFFDPWCRHIKIDKSVNFTVAEWLVEVDFNAPLDTV